MNALQQNSMGFSPLANGGFNQNFGNAGFGGFSGLNGNVAGGMMGPAGFDNQMNGILQQQAAMSSMINQMMNILMMTLQMNLLKQMQAMVSSGANFGGGGTSGGSGIGNFLGGGTSSVGGSSAPAATSSDFGSVPGWGAALAKDAERHAVSGPGGWCFKYVRQALERAGVKGVGGASAYMAADQLAKNPKFREIKVAPADLPKLPAGAVVVWDRNGSGASAAGKQHGHISISLGDGREVSDLVRKQTTSMGSNVRVFLPK